MHRRLLTGLRNPEAYDHRPGPEAASTNPVCHTVSGQHPTLRVWVLGPDRFAAAGLIDAQDLRRRQRRRHRSTDTSHERGVDGGPVHPGMSRGRVQARPLMEAESARQQSHADAVACQRDGTTSLPRAWDHLEVLVSIVGLAFGVKAGVPVGVGSLSVGGAFDDEGVRAGGEPVDGGLGEQGVAHHREPLCGLAV
jgi:hypothetical protein